MKKIFTGPFVLLAMVCVLFLSCEPDLEDPVDPSEPVEPVTGGGVTDRDGNVYETIILGSQEWMARNLNVETANSWCYDDDPEYCSEYGRLYTWFVAGNACPDGWRLPTNIEWTHLEDILGENAGGSMKSTGTIEDGTGLWSSPNTGATNESRFSGIPGGTRDTFGTFADLGFIGAWWSSSGNDSGLVWTRILDYSNTGLEKGLEDKRLGLSIRCLRK